MIKKITNLRTVYFLLSISFILVTGQPGFAKQVPATDARLVAGNFFSKYASGSAVNCGLAYTSSDSQGNPLYYVFNINNNGGFVIISAEDAAQPIIGYSSEQGFQKPDPQSPAAFWLSKRESEIKFLRKNNVPANALIISKWSKYLTAQPMARAASVTSQTVAPLLLTKWNQSPFYNDSCPGGSVTGCVATTMAQIMRYWSYPAHGTGSSSYCNCSTTGFSNNYGILSANYGAATYNWNNMPLVLNGHNADIARLMRHCGISVHMNYDPAGSSAQVLNYNNNTPSAQSSFINYFKYDPSTILGAERNTYSDAAWVGLLKNDLDIGRPVQYAGFGSVGGHTWVCDGYDDNDFFHMNWGWGSASDGFFDIDNLNPGGDDFSNMQQAIFGIVPIGVNGADAGITYITPFSDGCSNISYQPTIKIRNYSNSFLTSFVLNYKIDNGPVQTMPWSGSLVTGQCADVAIPALSLPSGLHNITCTVSNPNNGTDINTANDQSSYSFSIYGEGTLPVVEGFETPAQTIQDWSIVPSQNGANWAFTSQAFSGGAKSIMINNLTNTAGNVSILQGLNNYDFSLLSQPTFYFKIAYQQKVATDKDKLNLEISSDCGKTWWVKWTKQGAALATTSALSALPFVPAPSDFVQYAIPGVINKHTAFRWVFTADAAASGNNIYLDDINLGEALTVGIRQNGSVSGKSFDVYPNPTNGETVLKFKMDYASTVEINVTDISGRKVIEMPETDYAAGEQLVSINKESVLTAGVYLVTVSTNGIKSSRKLIIN